MYEEAKSSYGKCMMFRAENERTIVSLECPVEPNKKSFYQEEN